MSFADSDSQTRDDDILPDHGGCDVDINPMDDGDQDYVPVHCSFADKLHTFLQDLDLTMDNMDGDQWVSALEMLQLPTGDAAQVPSMTVLEAITVCRILYNFVYISMMSCRRHTDVMLTSC